MDAMKRFNSKWRKNRKGCHVWRAGSKDRQGRTCKYGAFWHEGKTHRAHVWLFQQVHGYLPPVIMHTCDNTMCVNERHLYPGTHEENMADMAAKGRARNQHLVPSHRKR